MHDWHVLSPFVHIDQAVGGKYENHRVDLLKFSRHNECCSAYCKYGLAAAPERSTFDHVTPVCLSNSTRRPPHFTIAVISSTSASVTLYFFPRPVLKSPLASSQNRLPTIPGSRSLAISSCQDKSVRDLVRDASPVEPSLGTTYHRTRGLLI